ncbi:MAG: hypothetical protein QM579_07670 [Desulfovibrio sp.]
MNVAIWQAFCCQNNYIQLFQSGDFWHDGCISYPTHLILQTSRLHLMRPYGKAPVLLVLLLDRRRAFWLAEDRRFMLYCACLRRNRLVWRCPQELVPLPLQCTYLLTLQCAFCPAVLVVWQGFFHVFCGFDNIGFVQSRQAETQKNTLKRRLLCKKRTGCYGA